MNGRMDAAITFTVPGDPVPQPRARATRRGHMYTPDKNGIGVFKEAIGYAAKAQALLADWSPNDECYYDVEVEAIFARPPSHLTKAGGLRAGVPRYPGHRSGDNDNIEKGVWDAITKCGSVWIDDSQVVTNRTAKRYAEPGEAARTVVTVRRLPP